LRVEVAAGQGFRVEVAAEIVNVWKAEEMHQIQNKHPVSSSNV
jgi:hypothetical protein